MVKLRLMRGFPFHRVIGNIAKEIVRSLLDESGYRTYPYGYESFLSNIKYELHRKDSAKTDSIKRLRSHPDLLVYNERTGDITFIEVKFRKSTPLKTVTFNAKNILWYQKYWNDSVMILVTQIDEVFYAQYINKLPVEDSTENDTLIDFNLKIHFVPINKLFRINSEVLKDYYIPLAKQIPKIQLEREEDEFILFTDKK
ncbi:MAG: hypothetical protein QMD13_07985 [Candidatus Bathyarchaeia archaeon]|nr:hypothetical protein [Candidatus Bathyarchaeia archaeon]